MHPRVALASLGCTLLLGACTAGPRAPEREAPGAAADPALVADVQQISKAVAATLRQQDTALWTHWTEGAALDFSADEAHAARLKDPRTLASVQKLRSQTRGVTERRALTHLFTYLVGESLAKALAAVNDERAELEASLLFQATGVEHRYRDLERILAQEPSASRREAIYRGATSAVTKLAPVLQKRAERLDAALQAQGLTRDAFAVDLRDAELSALSRLAEQTLSATDATYLKLADALAQRHLAMNAARLRSWDLPRLVRPPDSKPQDFPKGRALERVRATLTELGLPLESMKQLTVDDRDVVTKRPAPLTVAVAVPSDVRLSLKPLAGFGAQAALWHEVGYALSHALTTEPRFELAKLGNTTVAKAFALLFEDLATDPTWLAQQGLPEATVAQMVASARLRRLFQVRRFAGRVLYQLAAQQAPGRARTLYSQHLARALKLQTTADDDARFLVDRDDFYESADSLRAMLLAAQLKARLRERFGAAWWKSPGARELLVSLWAPGSSRTVQQVAQAVGDAGLTVEPLLRQSVGN
jgi:hypothetical protein